MMKNTKVYPQVLQRLTELGIKSIAKKIKQWCLRQDETRSKKIIRPLEQTDWDDIFWNWTWISIKRSFSAIVIDRIKVRGSSLRTWIVLDHGVMLIRNQKKMETEPRWYGAQDTRFLYDLIVPCSSAKRYGWLHWIPGPGIKTHSHTFFCRHSLPLRTKVS